MKKFYSYLKILSFIIDTFFVMVFLFLIFVNLLSAKYKELSLIFLIMLIGGGFITIVETILLKYYGNIVVSIEYQDDNVILITNKERYILPGKYFTEVKEDISTARTYIKYNDGKKAKTFVYQMKYSPFKTYYLNIDEMKIHMPFALFI